MSILVVLLAAVSCTIAKPLTLGYELPELYNYRYGYSPALYPVAPVVRGVIPGAVASPHFHFSAPYFAGIKSQYHEQDLFGQARYGHIEPGQSHHAIQDAFGNKIGGFNYYNPEGKLVQTSYIADAAGYRVASNDLPVAPIDTPEVAAAKAAHFIEVAKIKGRFRRQADNFGSFQSNDYRFNQPLQHAYPTSNLLPKVTNDGFLEETPEVLAAKADHFAKVAASKAHIATLERNSGNSYNPISHQPTNTFSSFDYNYRQNYQNTGYNPGAQETPETIAAKAKYFADLAAAKSRNAGLAQPIDHFRTPITQTNPNPIIPNTNTFQQTPNTFQQSSNVFQQNANSFQQDYRYAKQIQHAYPTTNLAPVVTRDGFLEETPEVLAAKANHFSQFAAAQARALA